MTETYFTCSMLSQVFYSSFSMLVCPVHWLCGVSNDHRCPSCIKHPFWGTSIHIPSGQCAKLSTIYYWTENICLALDDANGKDTAQHNAVQQDRRHQDTDSAAPAYGELDQTPAGKGTSCQLGKMHRHSPVWLAGWASSVEMESSLSTAKYNDVQLCTL